ncbi:MAG: hypothetical protein L6R45_03290 [Anaerolineae bacterium]|nr:hypothetical protein [Anaerolineae bacterium]
MVSASKPTLIATPQVKNLSLSWPLILVVILAIVRGVLYLSIFPPFLAPDEAAHFEAIRLIGQEKKWPTAEVYATTPMHPEMIPTFEKYRIWYLANQDPSNQNVGLTTGLFTDYYAAQISAGAVRANSYLMLYHLTLAPLSAATASFDLTTQVYLLRFVSVLFTAATVVIAWITVKTIFPAQPGLALAVVSFITLWPMHTHVGASVTVDPLAELLASAFFLLLVKIWVNGFSLLKAVGVVSLMALTLLTKPTTFFLLPSLAAALIVFLGCRLKWPPRLTNGLLVLLVGVTLIGSILLHQYSDGGRRVLLLLATPFNLPAWEDLVTDRPLSFYVGALNFAVLSFAGLFGWSNIHIPWVWVRWWAVGLFLMGLGSLIFCYQCLLRPIREEYSTRQRSILIFLLLALILSLIGVATPIIGSESSSWGIHSRYYFPAIIPLALYLYLGFRQLFPGGWRNFALPVWIVGWFTYDCVVLFIVILPYLYS